MIPRGLLDNCTQTTSFYGCFGGFTQCSHIESKLPELWENPELSDGSCFAGCTNASNYDQVPAGWGGPAENV